MFEIGNDSMNIEQPQSIRTIFFDAGFTLLQPYPSLAEICSQVCQQFSLHVQIDQVAERIGNTEDLQFRQLHANDQTWANEQAIETYWIDYYMLLLRPFIEEHNENLLYQTAYTINQEFNKHTRWQIFSDVEPTLELLHKHNYTLGVISDWGISLGPILREHRLTQYFDCLLTSAAAREAKPSPILYERALQRLNAIPDYSLHIGDSYVYDVLGARSVGITPVLLDRTHTLNQRDVDCPLVYSLDGLLDLLEVERA
jgi:putative hydrolase of the HAD superfamily